MTDFERFLNGENHGESWLNLKALEIVKDNFFKGFLQRYDDQEKAAFKTIWKAADVPFLEFIQHPENFRNPSDGSVNGLIYKDDNIKVGKELLHFALNKANEYSYGIDFFFKDNEIDYEKVTWFSYGVFVIDLIGYVDEAIEKARTSPADKYDILFYKLAMSLRQKRD